MLLTSASFASEACDRQSKEISYKWLNNAFLARAWFDDKTQNWAMSVSQVKGGEKTVVAVNNSLAPMLANSGSEIFSLHGLVWNDSKIQITFAVKLDKGNYRAAYYRLGVAEEENAWRVVEYGTSYHHIDRETFSTTNADLRASKSQTCQEGGLFSCASAVSTTASLKPAALIPLAQFPSVIDFSAQPISNILVR